MDGLEEKWVIGPFEGSKPRNVLMTKQQYMEMLALNDDTAALGSLGAGSSEETE